MMKNRKEQDERTILTRRKIQSDAYQLLLYFLLISLLVQKFFLNAPFSQIAVEFFCTIGSGLYITIRHLMAGIDIWGSKEQNNYKVIIATAVSSIVVLILFAFLSGEQNPGNLALFFLCYTFCMAAIQVLIKYINQKKQKSIDDQLDKDEMSE